MSISKFRRAQSVNQNTNTERIHIKFSYNIEPQNIIIFTAIYWLNKNLYIHI